MHERQLPLSSTRRRGRPRLSILCRWRVLDPGLLLGYQALHEFGPLLLIGLAPKEPYLTAESDVPLAAEQQILCATEADGTPPRSQISRSAMSIRNVKRRLPVTLRLQVPLRSPASVPNAVALGICTKRIYDCV